MFTLNNPENERRRAQSILRSFTEYSEAVNLFSAADSRNDRNCTQETMIELAAKASHNHG